MSILGPTQATVEVVVRRDQGRCAKCGNRITGHRGIDWSIHHRRPRGMGGSSLKWVNQPANLVTLCGSGTTGCHGIVESDRADAFETGFLVLKNGPARSDQFTILHAIHGEVFLNDDGGYSYPRDVA